MKTYRKIIPGSLKNSASPGTGTKPRSVHLEAYFVVVVYSLLFLLQKRYQQ